MTGSLFVYVGTYTRTSTHAQDRSDGLYVYRLNPATGALSLVSTVPGLVNPSFLALDVRRRLLYAVNEVAELDGQPGGAVSAFAIDRPSGMLTALNRQRTHGADPCYLSLDQTAKWLLVANYTSGSMTLLPIQADGALGQAAQVMQHQGSSVHPDRQAGPHAHSIVVDGANRFVLVADLGLDKIMLYRLDAAQGKLIPHAPPWASVKPGAGPRHLAFHPDGRWLYATNELDSTVTACSYDAQRGVLQELQSLSTLPQDFAGVNYPAHVQVSPSGQFLYVSNRGHDSLAVLQIDEATGVLTTVAHVSTRGQWPRHFTLDPTGNWLLAANQRSDTLVTFRVDPATGRLAPTGQVTKVPAPVCVHIVDLA